MVDCNKYFQVLVFSEPIPTQIQGFIKKLLCRNMSGQNWMKMQTLKLCIVSGLPSIENE